MMTIPSIDMMTIDNAVAAGASSAPVAPADRGAVAQFSAPLTDEHPTFGGLAELVADNEALGKALQSLVDSMCMPRPLGDAEARVVVAAEVKPAVKVDAILVAAENLKPTVAVDALPDIVERSVVVDAIVPIASAQKGVPLINAFETNASGVKTAASKGSVADANADGDPAILQAAPITAVPVVDVAASMQVKDVAPVASVTPTVSIDVNDMFLAAAESVASAISVSPELMRGEAGEIRVQLRSDVLEGTEVVVAVDGKKMDVTFVPAVTHVADTVAANQPLVQQQLAAKIAGFEISVAVAQTVATNVSVGVASSVSAQAAVARARRTNGRA